MGAKTDNSDTIKRKEALIVALEASLGIVTTACKKAGIARATYYEWMASDETFKKQVQDLSEITLDFAESKLHEQMNSGSVASIIFYLKTKGKKRGYVERSEIEISGGSPDFSDMTTDEIEELLRNGESEDS